jgi:hypothetical protein
MEGGDETALVPPAQDLFLRGEQVEGEASA